MNFARPLARAVIAIAACALAACQEQASAPVPSEASPDAKPGISVSGGRLVLPVIRGNPGAAYFVLENRGGATVRLAAVAIDGAAKAQMHQLAGGSMIRVDEVEILSGASMKFEPGALHAMVFDLDDRLRPGGETEMTLTFAGGDKISAPVKLQAAGAAAGL